MEKWKRNLFICCIASFITSIGMSQMQPILPLYVHEMGIEDPSDVARWSGLIFGANFISLAIFSPIWGRLSDKYGRKPMVLRASAALGTVMILLGFAQSVHQLLLLRLILRSLGRLLAPALLPLAIGYLHRRLPVRGRLLLGHLAFPLECLCNAHRRTPFSVVVWFRRQPSFQANLSRPPDVCGAR